MLKKPMTLTDFIYTEMQKYHIENNPKNLKNMRNEVNHLLATNPILKKKKNKLAPLTDPKDARKKLYPASLWSKVEKNEKFKNYALKHADPSYSYADVSWFLNHLKYTRSQNYTPIQISRNKIDIKPIFGKKHKDIDITYVLLRLIFSKLYPNQHINITKLQKDISKIKNKNTDRNEYIKIYTRLTDLTSYLIPNDEKKEYMKNLTEISPKYLLTRIKEIK